MSKINSFNRIVSLSLILMLPVSIVHAEPTVIVNDPTLSEDTSASTPTDPQVAPAPSSPFNEPPADALANPNSLASAMHPSDNELSAANQELLGRNAKLQRDVNDLETRVNVLINERSGQLFMYGAITVTIALFIGFSLGWFIFGRRDNW